MKLYGVYSIVDLEIVFVEDFLKELRRCVKNRFNVEFVFKLNDGFYGAVKWFD